MPRAALVLAGGRGTRLGGARKVALDIAGASALDRVLAACAGWMTIVVGPADLRVPPGVVLVTDEPPFGGPVSGLRAGLAVLPDESDLVAVLAADQPFVTAEALEALVRGVADGEAAAYVTGGGVEFLCAVWRAPALRARVAAAGASMRSVYADAAVVLIPDERGWASDVDTPEDLARARARAGQERTRSNPE